VGLILCHTESCLIIYTQKCGQKCYHSSSQALSPLTTSPFQAAAHPSDNAQVPGKGGGTW